MPRCRPGSLAHRLWYLHVGLSSVPVGVDRPLSVYYLHLVESSWARALE